MRLTPYARQPARKLSDFFDFTDLEYNYAEDADDEDDETGESDVAEDPETGYAYGIDDMQWFAADEGLVSLRAIRGHVAESGLEGLDDDEAGMLLEELDDCIQVLEDTAARQGRFHLAVIE